MTQQVLVKKFEGFIKFKVKQTKTLQEKKVIVTATYDTSHKQWQVHVTVSDIKDGEFDFSVLPTDMADLHSDVLIRIKHRVLQHLLAQKEARTLKSFHFSGKWS